MKYLLFANPQTGKPVLNKLVQSNIPPSVVVTFMRNKDSWKGMVYRHLTRNNTVEDICRYWFKVPFYDYFSLDVKRLRRIIKNEQIEIAFIATFSKIIPKELVELFPRGVFNLHPSLLPKHGGANPFFWIIYNEDKYSGTTCHEATDVLDSGKVFYQTKYEIKGWNSKMLFNAYVEDCVIIIRSLNDNFEQYSVKAVEMDAVEFDPRQLPAKEELQKLAVNAKLKERINLALKLRNMKI